MIALLRIDERLIHGQVATSWSKALDIDTIVCASDEAAQNPLKKKMLLIAAPPGKKTHVRSVDEVIGLLQDPRAERMRGGERVCIVHDRDAFGRRLVIDFFQFGL